MANDAQTFSNKALTWISAAVGVVTLGGGFVWVGATDYRGAQTSNRLDAHISKSAHDAALKQIATLEADYKHFNDNVKEIKVLIRALEMKINDIRIELLKENNRQQQRN